MVNKQNISKVAFPHEHGSWGFFLEPIVLALIIGYSSEGLLLGISSFLLFLASQSLSIVLKRKPEYLISLSIKVLLSYCVVVLILFGYVFFEAKNQYFLYPFISAMLIMLFYKYLEVKNQNRILAVELLAPISVILISVSILVLANWEFKFLVAYAIVVLSRSIQTVFYINNKLKFFKGYKPNKILVNIVGIIFLILLLLLANIEFIPFLSVIGIVMLIARAILGLLEKNRKEKVIIVGIKEFIYGFLFVAIISLGYLYKL